LFCAVSSSAEKLASCAGSRCASSPVPECHRSPDILTVNSDWDFCIFIIGNFTKKTILGIISQSNVSILFIALSFPSVQLMKSKYQPKSVWLFVDNVLMVGSPDARKTLLARSVPGILPENSIEESLDVTRIYSVADQLPPGNPIDQTSSVSCASPHDLACRFGRRWKPS